ncbi:type II secretion system F family protein [Pleionea sp. CnH1-48]|uniref:type II secretion system F family protein n=1 Tax=Pleionea sp. CnH1-48 TaxID=2954494 RepID=UPI002098342F|nr:type II secretion system F family protein [Pleionea sp. CnH1-48]MCO7223837.1 type II secretion system F family protein [Pleionea sp. CnH1-48]
MTVITLVAILFAFTAAMLTYVGWQMLSKAAVSYRENFTSQAKVRAADLFLFVEPEKIFIFNIILIVISFLFAFLMFESLVPSIIAAVLMGFFPSISYKVLKKKRHETFIKQLPDMLQSSATAMKAGSSLNQAIESVVMEETGPISQEFDLFLRELRVGVDFNEALNNIYTRIPMMDLKLVISGMQISREIGGNLADTLERLADTLRRKIEMEGKIDALTAQGRAQGFVMTALPILLGLVLYQMEPEQMSLLWEKWYGWIVIAIVVLMEVMGYFFIRKIVNIDV